jgi:hypothetical protein
MNDSVVAGTFALRVCPIAADRDPQSLARGVCNARTDRALSNRVAATKV